ncbi:MAG: HEAT repeat domain-containing protein [Candidatus Brocadiia bacterium]
MKTFALFLVLLGVISFSAGNYAFAERAPRPPGPPQTPKRSTGGPPTLRTTGTATASLSRDATAQPGQNNAEAAVNWEDWWKANNGYLLEITPSSDTSYLETLDPASDVVRLLAMSAYCEMFEKGIQQIAFDALRGMGDKGRDVLLSIVEGKYTFDKAIKTNVFTPEWYGEAAVRALGYVGGDKAEEALLGLLADKAMNRRFWACDALGRIGKPASLKALEGVLTADSDKFVRSAAAVAIARIGGKDAVAALRKGYSIAKDLTEARAYITLALGYVGACDPSQEVRTDPAITECIRIALADGKPEIRCAAVLALGFLNRPEYFDSILATIEKDGDYQVRTCASAILGKADVPAAEAGRVVTALIKAAREDSEALPKAYACLALSKFRHDNTAYAAIREALQDTGSRDMALISLGLYGNPAAAEDILDIMKKGEHAPSDDAARISLGLLGDEANAPGLVAGYMFLSSPLKLETAAFAIAKSATPDTYVQMLKYLDDVDIYLREGSIKSLMMMRNLTDDSRKAVLAGLTKIEKDPDANNRFLAVVARCAMGDRKALAIALSAMYDKLPVLSAGTVVDHSVNMYHRELTELVNDAMPPMYRIAPCYLGLESDE